MNRLLVISFFTYSIVISAQVDRVLFTYDDAGNQTKRELCINCFSSKTIKEEVKDEKDLKEEDYQKMATDDVVAFYPNPVKEELYLKWDLIDGNSVSKIEVYSLQGQMLKSYNELENGNSKVIYFQEYAIGTYSVILFYTNGKQKSITIIKQ